MNHVRLVFNDTPETIAIPKALQHRRTEVIILSLDDEIIDKPAKRHLLDLIGQAKGCYKNAAEIDSLIRAERDKWDD
ncbi:hypothetical protein AU255_14035 [Methyloprofundus sedimenti]|uniref:Uncharacterized protein n=1 Tax=Methyloprofundus sedimenti TaxID=1420851 RepID=A0A1V8M3R9_9GAMM|nr:hypothetical protein [Methyloprofundus sedimenti]OQK16215.1 hypothetical protein AU255_14035 [Methyloprofundus sedimenti]